MEIGDWRWREVGRVAWGDSMNPQIRCHVCGISEHPGNAGSRPPNLPLVPWCATIAIAPRDPVIATESKATTRMVGPSWREVPQQKARPSPSWGWRMQDGPVRGSGRKKMADLGVQHDAHMEGVV
jgi:hypothetical protein